MDTNFWGRPTWIFLHSVSFNYSLNPTPEEKLKYLNFYKSVATMLPCQHCARSYELYLKYIPIEEYLDDIYGITYWVYLIHFIVNKKLNKPNTDYYQVVKLYLNNKTSCDFIPSLSGKCTKEPSKNTKVDKEKIMAFYNMSKDKYFTKSNGHLSNLISAYPSLQP